MRAQVVHGVLVERARRARAPLIDESLDSRLAAGQQLLQRQAFRLIAFQHANLSGDLSMGQRPSGPSAQPALRCFMAMSFFTLPIDAITRNAPCRNPAVQLSRAKSRRVSPASADRRVQTDDVVLLLRRSP